MNLNHKRTGVERQEGKEKKSLLTVMPFFTCDIIHSLCFWQDCDTIQVVCRSIDEQPKVDMVCVYIYIGS